MLFSFSLAFAQKEISPEIRVGYFLEAKKNLNENAKVHQEEFWLIANSNESVFKAKKAYVFDSLADQGLKFEETLDHFDMKGQSNIFIRDKKIEFTNSIKILNKLGYVEENTWNWKIVEENKEILGLKCQKATITKYGRNWVAYYTPAYLIPFGPYKFNNLPGLILEVFDDKGDYHYTATSIEKFTKKYSVNRFMQPKIYSKTEYLKVKKNIESDFSFGGTVTLSVEDLKRFNDSYERRMKYDNPIELSLN
ncbi:GLPGLI family protein [Chryseobacterium echinoideorum]|uniref:GLPGLI family protein n=1 Tax=Chryseobacterium echinoideorum TaxID=1549648 RepID=UPI0011853E26|nr:GLPGLI family protein [Chryseobacterium echinoideorum]